MAITDTTLYQFFGKAARLSSIFEHYEQNIKVAQSQSIELPKKRDILSDDSEPVEPQINFFFDENEPNIMRGVGWMSQLKYYYADINSYDDLPLKKNSSALKQVSYVKIDKVSKRPYFLRAFCLTIIPQ